MSATDFSLVESTDIFVHLAGADGSVRMFDLRHLEHSTIIYEDPQHQPLLRLAWNKQDPNYLATMAMDALEVTPCDISFVMVALCNRADHYIFAL